MSSRRRTYGVSELYNSKEFYSLVSFFRSDNDNVDTYLCYTEDGINFQPIKLLTEDFPYSSDPLPVDISVSMDGLVYSYIRWDGTYHSVYEYNPVNNSIKQVIIKGNPRIPNNPFKCHNYDYYSGYLNMGKIPYREYGGIDNSSDYFISNNDGYYKIIITTDNRDKVIRLFKCDEGRYEEVDKINTGLTSSSFYYSFTYVGLIQVHPYVRSTLYKIKDGKLSVVKLDFITNNLAYLNAAIINEGKELQLIDTFSKSFKVYDFDGNTILDGTMDESITNRFTDSFYTGRRDYGNFKSHFIYLPTSKLLSGEYVSDIVRVSDYDYFRTAEKCNMSIPEGHTKRYQIYAITCYVPDALFRLNA